MSSERTAGYRIIGWWPSGVFVLQTPREPSAQGVWARLFNAGQLWVGPEEPAERIVRMSGGWRAYPGDAVDVERTLALANRATWYDTAEAWVQARNRLSDARRKGNDGADRARKRKK